MSFFQDFFKKKFFIHLGVLLVLIVIAFWGTFKVIDKFTRHGDVYFLPHLEGMTLEQADEKGFTKAFEFVVVDSVYSRIFPAGSIVMQKPSSNSKVKKGRKVYVTIVATGKEMVKMPNLVDLSFRQASVELDMVGLKIKQLEYVPDIARNAVLAQLYMGDTIAPNEDLAKGEGITLILGEGTHIRTVKVPLIVGLDLDHASEEIHQSFLNMGHVIYLDDDTLNAIVYKQRPGALHNQRVNPGQAIDIWMKTSEEFDLKSHLKELEFDSTELDWQKSFDFNIDADSLIYLDTISPIDEPSEGISEEF